jgi:hypothetical protein
VVNRRSVCVCMCECVCTRVERGGNERGREKKKKCEWLHQFNSQKWLSRRDAIVS